MLYFLSPTSSEPCFSYFSCGNYFSEMISYFLRNIVFPLPCSTQIFRKCVSASNPFYSMLMCQSTENISSNLLISPGIFRYLTLHIMIINDIRTCLSWTIDYTIWKEVRKVVPISHFTSSIREIAINISRASGNYI